MPASGRLHLGDDGFHQRKGVVRCVAMLYWFAVSRHFSCTSAARPAPAQQEVYHPGETYDSLQAGQDAYMDAEAQRRALIGRQIMIEDQIMQQNTWADPQDKYRPVHPESYGPVLPKAYAGPTLADVYAYPTDGGPVYYGGTPAPLPEEMRPAAANSAAVMLPRCPCFSLGRGCRTIFGGRRTTATCGSRSVTSRSGPVGSATFTNRSTPHRRWKPRGRRRRRRPPRPRGSPRRPPLAPDRATGTRRTGRSPSSPPPPPRPAVPPPARLDARPAEGPDLSRRAIRRRPGRKFDATDRDLTEKNRGAALDASRNHVRIDFLRYAAFAGVLRKSIDAGWSSPVAREAHNLEVTGSNPVPATFCKSCWNQTLVTLPTVGSAARKSERKG